MIDREDRFIAYDNGTVLDTQTGLLWAAKDDGKGMNEQDAKVYFKNYRAGGYADWRMPTVDELEAIYDQRKLLLTIFGSRKAPSQEVW